MQWADLLSFLRVGENETTKFFSKIRHEDELGPVIVGLHNSKGGRIFVGMDLKNYHLLGTNIDRQWVEGLIKDHCSPTSLQIKLDFISKNDKVILCVEVPEGSRKPAYYKKQCFVLQTQEPFSPLLQSITTPVFKLADSLHPEVQLPLEAVVLEEESIDLGHLTSELLSLHQALQEETAASSSKKEVPKEEKSINRPKLNSRQNQVVEYLKQHLSVSNKQYRALYKVSHKTAHIELVDLVAKGYLIQTGAGRNTAYSNLERSL